MEIAPSHRAEGCYRKRVKRLRFPLAVIAGFGLAYACGWFAVRGEYRVEHPPVRPPAPGTGAAILEVRKVLATETDLLHGTSVLVMLIPELDARESAVLSNTLSGGEFPCPPIWSQARTMLEYRTEQYHRAAPPKGTGWFPVFVFDYSNPFPASEVPGWVEPSGNSEEVLRKPSSTVHVGPIHWALRWLDRRDPAAGMAFLGELGPEWPRSSMRWLKDFISAKSVDEATPWLERIALPGVRAVVNDAVVRAQTGRVANNAPIEKQVAKAAMRQALKEGGDSLRDLIKNAETWLPREGEVYNNLPGEPETPAQATRRHAVAAFLKLTLGAEDGGQSDGRKDELIRLLFHSDTALFREYLRDGAQAGDSAKSLSRAVIRYAPSIPELLNGGDGFRMEQHDAIKLLDLCHRSYSPEFEEKVRAELIDLWVRTRTGTSWGPYENGLLQLCGLPPIPEIVPVPEKEEP